jgi:putative Ca2+/H+ antiporter (TMEM165/GDT1 family)
MTVDLLTSVTTFALIFPAELPDKTFIATLVLATRFPRRAVWIAVAAAFAVQTAIAVLAGGMLSLAPTRLVLGITFPVFTVGAVIMARGGLKSRAAE